MYAIGRKANTAGQRSHVLLCVRCGRPVRVYRDDLLYTGCRSCRGWGQAGDETTVICARIADQLARRMVAVGPCRTGAEWQHYHAVRRQAAVDLVVADLARRGIAG